MERPHRILITGATDGLGLLLVRSYAARGHFILATGRRHLSDHRAFFGIENVAYLRAELEHPTRAARLISETLTKIGWKELDLVILNAATGWAGNPETETPRSIETQIAVNLTAPACIAAEIAPWLFAARGKLALIGSTAVKGQRTFATYAATKAGLDGLARSLREEWQGLADVLIVHPGPTRTNMHEKAGLSPGFLRLFFMRPRRAAKAVERAIRSRAKRRTITRTYAFFARKGKEGRL